MFSIKAKTIRLANASQITEQNFEQAEFFVVLSNNKEVRAYYFDEDAPVPSEYVEVDYVGGRIPLVSLFCKKEDVIS